MIQESEMSWIRAEDSIPEILGDGDDYSEDVLVYLPEDEFDPYRIAWIEKQDETLFLWKSERPIDQDEIAHWMSIPKPPSRGVRDVDQPRGRG